MKHLIYILFAAVLLSSCNENTDISATKIHQPDWKSRQVSSDKLTSMTTGTTYLPVYSHVYQKNENRTFNLTITVSIRNISTEDTIYLATADYFNTSGDPIRKYLKSPVYVAPLETIELIIAENDNEGGSGANFIFDWATKQGTPPPLLEAIMISTYHQQGLSFSTRGVVVE